MTINIKLILLSFLLISCTCTSVYYRELCRAPPTVKTDPTTGNVTFRIGAENRHGYGYIPSAVDLNITYIDESDKSTKIIDNDHTVEESRGMFLVSKSEMESTAAGMGRNLTIDLKTMGLGTETNLITATFKPVSGVSDYSISLKNIDANTYYDDVCTLELKLLSSSYPNSSLYYIYSHTKYMAQHFIQTSTENVDPVVTWEIIDDDWMSINGTSTYVFRSPHNMMDILVWAEGVFSQKTYDEVLQVKVTVEGKESELLAWKGNFQRYRGSYSSEADSFNRTMTFLLALFLTAVALGILFIAAGSVACVRGKMCCK
eukprot:sb/3466958/